MGCTTSVKQSNKPRQCIACPQTPLQKQVGGVAEDYAECSICFEPLCSHRCGMLMKDGQRVCRHLTHQRCAKAMQGAGRSSCPECRQEYDSIKLLPDLKANNIQEWFQAVDLDGDGRLSKIEVLQVLKAQLRLDWKALERHIDDLWATWDQDGSGDLAFEELIAPNGLVHYVTGVQVAQSYVARKQQEAPALSDVQNWFNFWDEDYNGSLDKQEVQRALIKTFHLETDVDRIGAMRETLSASWRVYDIHGTGDIDIHEFTMPGGLGETLALSMHHWMAPAEVERTWGALRDISMNAAMDGMLVT